LLKEEWCIPHKQNAEFVYRMEDVLEVYQRPKDARFPLICFDETSVQLISETRQSIPAQMEKRKHTSLPWYVETLPKGKIAGHCGSYRNAWCN